MKLDLTDPLVLKAGGGALLYAFSSSRTARMAGLALLGWAAWDYFGKAQPPAKVIPYDRDAPQSLEAAATSSAPASSSEGGKVIPLRPPTPEERAMFYGINPAGDDGATG